MGLPGTDPSSLGKAEDAVHASGDTGVMALAVRNADEEGALVQAQKTRLAVLSRLKLDEEADEEGDEDDDDEK